MATRTLTLILLGIGLGIVTTAVTLILTPALHVDASNESSYHYGFRAGLGKYQCLSESTRYLYGTCDDLPHSDDVNTDCVSLAHWSYGRSALILEDRLKTEG